MRSKPRIGIIIDQLVPGGVQKSAINETKNLIRLGHKITLFILVRQQYNYQYEDLTAGIPVIYLSDSNPWFLKNARRVPFFSFLTHLHILNSFLTSRYTIFRDYDLIISHGTTTCITAAAISKKYKIPYVAYIWDPMLYILEKVYRPTRLQHLFIFLKPLIKTVESSFLRSAALVITPSKVHQEYILKTYGINPYVIYPGSYPPKTIPNVKDPDGRKYILGYTRWELTKNPYFFLWLAQRIPAEIKILVAGSWTNPYQEQKFRELILEKNLQDRVMLTSPITKKDLSKIARKSFVWVHPNFEALGIAGLEMASLGLPVIIPKGSGLTELFTENKQGFFPHVSNKMEFLDRILYLYHNPQRARSFGVAAAKVAKKYTWDYHAKCVSLLAQEYLAKPRIICLANAFVFHKSIGGGDRFLIELAQRAPKNVHLSVILPQVGLFHWQQAQINNPHIRLIQLPSTIFDNHNHVLFIFAAYLIRSIQTFFLLRALAPFNQIHSSSDYLPDILPAYLYKKFCRNVYWSTRFFHFIGNPFTRKGNFFRNLGAYILQQFNVRLFRFSDIILIDNPTLKTQLTKKNIMAKKIATAFGGVDYYEFSRAKPRATTKYKSDAIFVGRFAPHKGVFDAIHAWKIVTQTFPHARLAMIGYGPASITHKVQLEIKRLHLPNNINLVGFIHERHELVNYYASSKLFLFLDYEAGFGLAAIEALAANLPIIAYKLPIFGTVYTKGYLLAEFGDVSTVAHHVVDLLTNKKKYSRLRFMAGTEAHKFDWSIASRNFYQLLLNSPE